MLCFDWDVIVNGSFIFLIRILSAILFLYKNIDSTVLLVGLPVYGALLLTMCWRAIARFRNVTVNKKLFGRPNVSEVNLFLFPGFKYVFRNQ